MKPGRIATAEFLGAVALVLTIILSPVLAGSDGQALAQINDPTVEEPSPQAGNVPGAHLGTASDSEIVTIPYEKAYESGFEDMPRRVPDLTKAKNLVGYEPRVQLPEILTKVIEHHRAQRMEYV